MNHIRTRILLTSAGVLLALFGGTGNVAAYDVCTDYTSGWFVFTAYCPYTCEDGDQLFIDVVYNENKHVSGSTSGCLNSASCADQNDGSCAAIFAHLQ